MSWNIAGAKAIITEGFTVMSSCNYSIIVLQETWLVDPIELGGYSLHHIGAKKSNKSGRASGGLATYISMALQVTTEQLAFSLTDLQAINIFFSFNRHTPLIIFNVYAHPRKHRKVLLFEKLLQKVEEIRCANPTWDILVTGEFNSNLIYTPEPGEQLAAENAIWSVLPQLPSIQTKLDIRGKQLVEALEHLSMRVLNGRVEGDVPRRKKQTIKCVDDGDASNDEAYTFDRQEDDRFVLKIKDGEDKILNVDPDMIKKKPFEKM
ncbi:hypothetical protein NDU88_004903 [Pleurodeles waltl]|uniref:Endonuclease/exonuclease/phosphatase domain-containing protein n=1 Tax=Pleurodeles waltl TaxID=8319 RepID=A0AAV7NKX5_PLEWA|nr:hypothetical protein NDU88_004903 [Pleurodeles waltl]